MRNQVLDGWALGQANGHAGPNPAHFGVHGTNGTSIGFDDAMLGRHVLFLGGIGTGKTVGMSALVESLRAGANDNDVFVFFDTKGDYVDSFYRDGDAVIARGVSTPYEGQVTWNLFRELAAIPPNYELDEEVAELASTLFEGVAAAAGDNNRIWSQMGQELFMGLVLSLLREGDEMSNKDVRRIADEMTLSEMRERLIAHDDLRGIAQYIANDKSNAANSVLIFLQQAIQRVFRSSFRSPGDFSVRNFVRNKGGKALFLEYDVASGETLTPIFRTLIDIAIKEALGRNRADGRVFIILDEFALLPQLSLLANGLNFGRSLGLRFIVGTQNIAQVQQRYGADGGSSILSAFGTVFSFRLYDQLSREFIRGRFGKNRRVVRYDAVLKTRGVGEDIVEGSVVEDWDISSLAVGECVAALPDAVPFRFSFARPI